EPKCRDAAVGVGHDRVGQLLAGGEPDVLVGDDRRRGVGKIEVEQTAGHRHAIGVILLRQADAKESACCHVGCPKREGRPEAALLQSWEETCYFWKTETRGVKPCWSFG